MSIFDEFYRGMIDDSGKKRFVKTELQTEWEADQEELMQSESKPNFVWFIIFVSLVFVILISRLWFLQIAKGNYYFGLAEGNRIRIETTSGSRGIIYDSKGNKLVQNVASFNVEISPQDLPNNLDKIKNNINQASSILNLSTNDIFLKIKKSKGTDPIILKSDINLNQALALKEQLSFQKLIKVQEQATRSYISGFGLAHLLGYVGRVTEKDLKNSNYLSSDLIGKTGLEGFYEKFLKGKNGKEQIEIDAQGRLKRVLASEPAKSGDNLTVSLDLDLQKKVYESLKAAVGRRGSPGGTAIVMNPKNGEIYSMVSVPDFDNNIFTTTEKSSFVEQYSKLVNDKNSPLMNRAISGIYPSGSTIKPALAAAGLNEGVITPNTTVNDNKGLIEVPNKYNPSIIYKFPDWKIHGIVDVRKAIALSCDVFFYSVGGGFDKIKGLGLAKIQKYYREFGLGQKTGIDLTGESEGLVPSEEWKQKVKKETWYQGDTYHMSIGQGDLLVTPLQVLNFTAAIANGGSLLKPHFITEIRDSSGKIINKVDQEVIRSNFIRPENIKVVQEGMRQTVTSGTAPIFNTLPVAVAAKTGSAQFDNNTKTHTWVTAYAPYNDPQIVIVVMLEGGKNPNGESAMPAAREILNYYFTR